MTPVCAWAADPTDTPAKATNPVPSSFVFGAGSCAGATIIYDTTHAFTQGAEIATAANGPATNLADLIVLGGTNRFVCQVQVEVFTLAAVTPFDLTMNFWTACSTSGAANSPCGNGPGTLIPLSTVTVTGITPPALSTIFAVNFPYPNVDLGGEADNTISVSLSPSRSDVFWRIGETPVVGSLPAGEPATSFVERCGSVGANNGCSRNFGVNNNFAIQILANTTPVSLQGFSVE
ncbi:MAG: hypothetical protein ABIU84_02825 [Thermoanaerobaculia bacterium]